MTTIDLSALAALYHQHIDRLRQEYGRAIERAGYETLVIHSGTARKQNDFDDQYWPLRPTPGFAHWLPLREPDCALVIKQGERPRLLRASDSSYWEGKTPVESKHFWAELEVIEVASARMGEHVPSRACFVGETADRARQWGIADAAINAAPVIAALDAVRAIKSDYERACIAEANRRGAMGHAAVFDAFATGDYSELELHLLYLESTGQDATDTPYTNIFALGEHAATLHHVVYGRERPGAQAVSLLVDAGATFCGYASDITRTAVRGRGDGAPEFSALIAGIEELQREITRRVKPGLSFESLHDQAHELLAGVLCDVGIARGSAEELVAAGVTRTFLPHGLGHSLGIQVHDVGCRTKPPEQRNPFLRNTSDITVGHVFTVEPGCYFINSLLAELSARKAATLIDWPQVERMRGFGGVRIEDNVAVVDDGTRNLTRDNWPA